MLTVSLDVLMLNVLDRLHADNPSKTLEVLDNYAVTSCRLRKPA